MEPSSTFLLIVLISQVVLLITAVIACDILRNRFE